MANIKIPFPIFVAKEGKWFVASCPALDIATQGLTEKEVKENMEDLINGYLKDPDTVKPEMESIMSVSLANIPIDVPEGVLHRRKTPSSPAK